MFVSKEMAACEHCRFEPKHVHDVTDDDSSEDNEMNEQLNSTFWSLWCSCQRCEVMLTPQECIFCVGMWNWKTKRKVHIPILFLAL